MLIEIVATDSEVRPIRNKETQAVRIYKQIAYADLGQAYPVRIQIGVSEPLNPGLYDAQVPFSVGKYDSLEVHPFQPWICKKVEAKKPSDLHKAS